VAEEGADEQLVDAGDGLRPRQHAVAVDRGQGDKVAIRSGQTSRVMVIPEMCNRISLVIDYVINYAIDCQS